MGRLSDQQTAARGGVVLVLRFAVTSLLNYLLGVVLAWILAPAAFGVVGTAQAVLLLCGLALGAGVPWALASRAAAVAPDPTPPAVGPVVIPDAGAELSALFRSGLLLNTAAGAALAVALLAAEASGLRLIPSTSPVLLGATAATLPVLSFNAVLAGMLQGSRRFTGLGTLQSVEVTVKAAVAVALTTGAGMGADGVAVGFLAGACAATGVGLWSLRDLLPRRGELAARLTFRVSVPFWVGSASMAVLPTVDLLGLQLAGAASGVTTVTLAAYQVCGILARSVYYVADALIDAVFPFIARSRGTAGSHAWFVAGARWFPLGLLPVQVALLLAPAPVLALLFPSAYADAAGLLRVLDLGTVGLIGAGMLVKALYANDAAAAVAPRTALAAAVEVAALAALVPAAGAAGAAWAYSLGSWTAAVLLGAAYLRLQACVRPLTAVRGDVTARYLLCLAGCGTVLAVSQHQPGPLGGALIVIALGLFGVLAATTRLLSAQDLHRIRQLGAAVTGAARRTVSSARRALAGRAR